MAHDPVALVVHVHRRRHGVGEADEGAVVELRPRFGVALLDHSAAFRQEVAGVRHLGDTFVVGAAGVTAQHGGDRLERLGR